MPISGEDVIEMSGVETLHPGGFDLSRHIGELVDFRPATRVLDVSTGKGVFACLYAREFGSQVTDQDINPHLIQCGALRAAREGVTDRVEFKVGDSRELPFQDNAFDVVVNECAVGLTAIDAPQQVLKEMVRVARPGGKVVLHESTWLKTLPPGEKEAAARAMGTVPYGVDEWQQMLRQAGAIPEIVEDWSGIENLWKMRPGHRWNRNRPTDFLTATEKLMLFPRLAVRHGIGTLLELYRFQGKFNRYLAQGYLGYVLIVASKPGD